MLPYVTRIRRDSQYPEIGFDLPKTLALARRELTEMKIPSPKNTEKAES